MQESDPHRPANKQDNETGPDFWAFLEAHNSWRQSNPTHPLWPFCTTIFLVDKESKRVAGTGSVVYDDQELGENYRVEGPWIAGFNVHVDFRKLLAGVALYYAVTEQIQTVVDGTGIRTRVNLFTYPDKATYLVQLAGYHVDRVLSEHEDQVMLFKTFEPGMEHIRIVGKR